MPYIPQLKTRIATPRLPNRNETLNACLDEVTRITPGTKNTEAFRKILAYAFYKEI